MPFLKLILIFLSGFIWASEGNKYIGLNAQVIEHHSHKYLALSYANAPDWHTYWLNPGDTGLAPIHKFYNDQGTEINLSPEELPVPQKIALKETYAYGYENAYSFFFEIPQNILEQIQGKIWKLSAKILICHDICIPAIFDLSFNGTSFNTNEGSISQSISQEQLTQRLQELPKKIPFPLELEMLLVKGREENSVDLYSIQKNKTIINENENLIFPYPNTLLSWGKENLKKSQNQNLSTTSAHWSGEYLEPAIAFPINGVFTSPILSKFLYKSSNGWVVIEKQFDQFYNSIPNDLLKEEASSESTSSVYLLLLFALLGGFILNFMPCVLPVISLKIMSLMSIAHENKNTIRKHNLFYSLGIIISFLLLAIVVHILKISGQQIGWGFQLQSPLFVFTLSVIVFLMSLNLFGLFELRVPFSSKLASKPLRSGYIGDFFSGMLTTILSTPCSAPFLGSAIGFAFSHSIPMIYLIFFFVGIGLSSPFLLGSLFPLVLRKLPKPGAWMLTLKYLMGFALLLTFIWLQDILFVTIDYANHGLSIGIFMLSLFGVVFFNKHKHFKLSLIFAIVALAVLVTSIRFESNNKEQLSQNTHWQKWSVEKLDELKNDHQWVFIDFTAKWCLTCKVNKKIFLDTDGFYNFAKENKVTLLQGDWTKYDPLISNWLKKYSVAGIPAYFVQDPQGKITYLGETMSLEKLKNHIIRIP